MTNVQYLVSVMAEYASVGVDTFIIDSNIISNFFEIRDKISMMYNKAQEIQALFDSRSIEEINSIDMLALVQQFPRIELHYEFADVGSAMGL